MSTVLAKVNGYEITEEMLNETIAGLAKEQNIQVTSEDDKKQLLNELVARQLVIEDAMASGLTKTEEFEKMYREFVLNYSINQLFKTVNVTEEDALTYYNENKDQFKEPTIRASHILVATEEEANDVVKALEEGASFEALAAEKSSCPSSARGGDLGEFGRGQMVPEFEQAAFALEVGQVSGVVPTQFGFHIIKLTDKQDTVAFDVVKPQIQQFMTSMKQNELYTAFTTELRQKHAVEITE